MNRSSSPIGVDSRGLLNHEGVGATFEVNRSQNTGKTQVVDRNRWPNDEGDGIIETNQETPRREKSDRLTLKFS